MVDFQSRDTSRGRITSDEGRDASPDDDSPDPSVDETSSQDENSGEEKVGESTVAAAVVAVSNDRTIEEDPAGDVVVDALESAGHDVVTREVLRATHDSVQQTLDTLVKRDDVTTVVTTGGTGVSVRDVTVDAVRPLVDKALPGFGELFRRRYAESVGSDAIATRATAGIAEATPVFCLPGDAEAARIGVGEIVVEQAPRLVRFANRDEAADP